MAKCWRGTFLCSAFREMDQKLHFCLQSFSTRNLFFWVGPVKLHIFPDGREGKYSVAVRVT